MFAIVLLCALVLVATASDVIVLNEDNFASKTAGKNTHIKAFAPWCGHCKAMAATWEEYATAMKDTDTQVAEIDCTESRPLCARFGVTGFPTIFYLTAEDKAYAYQGGRDVDSFKSFAADPTKGKEIDVKPAEKKEAEVDESAVIDLTGANFEALTKGKTTFIKFFAPWCGFCKKIAPAWAQTALDLKAEGSKVQVARVDCTDKENNSALCSEYNIRGFPTLYLLDANNQAVKFVGERDVEGFKAFIADPSEGEIFQRPFVLNTGVPVLDDNWPMFRDDVLVLYKFKKLALSVVFAVGALFGMFLCCLCGGSSAKSSGKKKTE